MWKKLIWGVLIAEVVVSWPLSLINKPAKLKLETIFYPATEEETWNFQKRLALDTTKVKRFYYNKTTIIKERYLKNALVMMDLNNYFFGMHPREDVPGVDFRFKYPFTALLFLVLAIKVTMENKKYLKWWWVILGEILALSFLKQIDGWDLILWLPITYLLYLGSKELNKYRFGWLINLGLILITTIEIGRMFL